MGLEFVAVIGTAFLAAYDIKDKTKIPANFVYGFWALAFALAFTLGLLGAAEYVFSGGIITIFFLVAQRWLKFGEADAWVLGATGFLLSLHTWLAMVLITATAFCAYAFGVNLVLKSFSIKDALNFNAPYIPFILLGLILALGLGL